MKSDSWEATLTLDDDDILPNSVQAGLVRAAGPSVPGIQIALDAEQRINRIASVAVAQRGGGLRHPTSAESEPPLFWYMTARARRLCGCRHHALSRDVCGEGKGSAGCVRRQSRRAVLVLRAFFESWIDAVGRGNERNGT